MSNPNSAIHPTWDDFAKALQLVEIYVGIERNKCETSTLDQIRSLAKDQYVYDDPASYIRFVLYPYLMQEANWIDSDVHVGRGTFLHYYGRQGSVDEFFSQMVEMGSTRSTYLEMAAIVNRESDD